MELEDDKGRNWESKKCGLREGQAQNCGSQGCA
jgi:hypothetical protein